MSKSPAASASKWSNKKSLVAQVEKFWQRGLLLQEALQSGDFFPHRMTFKTPDSQALSNEFESVQHWISHIKQIKEFHFKYKTIRHRIIGENQIPKQAWLNDFETGIKLLNKQHEVDSYLLQAKQTKEKAPQLLSWIKQHPIKTLALQESWLKLLDFICWRQKHNDPNIYLRQVCLPGIDSKFIEQHRQILTTFLDLSLPASEIVAHKKGVTQFAARYGFRCKPAIIRFRLLDPLLSEAMGFPIKAECDIGLSSTDFKCLQEKFDFINQLKNIFITENETNFLAFPTQKNSMVIFGSGYGFNALAQVDWLKYKNIFYWGDIDTHGFAILNQLREKFPHTQSFLMDEETLKLHQTYWGQEAKKNFQRMHYLEPGEQALYQALIKDKYEDSLRLEQERISFDHLIKSISKLKNF